MNKRWEWTEVPENEQERIQQEAIINATVAQLNKLSFERTCERERFQHCEIVEEYETDEEAAKAKAARDARSQVRFAMEEQLEATLEQYPIRFIGAYEHHGEDAHWIQAQEDRADQDFFARDDW